MIDPNNLTRFEVARVMRSVLKKVFPKNNFSVRTLIRAAGPMIQVCWTGGPTELLVSSSLGVLVQPTDRFYRWAPANEWAYRKTAFQASAT